MKWFRVAIARSIYPLSIVDTLVNIGVICEREQS